MPTSVEPVKESARTRGSVGPGADDGGGVAGDHVEDAARKARALGEFGQRECGERRLGGRVRHHGAAGGECGAGLAGQHGGGEVPGRDQRGDPDRLAPDLHLGVVQVRGDALDIRALGLLGVEFEEGGGIVDLAARLGERLALFEGHDAGEILAMREHEVEPAAQQRRTGLRQGCGPGGKGGVGGIDGGRAFGGRKRRDGADPGAVGGVADGEARAAPGTFPAAVHIGEAAQERTVGKTRQKFI